MFSNNHFQFLNNISHIFIHFFTHTYFYKNFQFLHTYSPRIIHCSHQPLILCQETECPFQDYSRMLLNNKMTFFFLNWRGKQTDPFQIQILNPTRFQIKLQSDFGFTNAQERERERERECVTERTLALAAATPPPSAGDGGILLTPLAQPRRSFLLPSQVLHFFPLVVQPGYIYSLDLVACRPSLLLIF